jgi:hypothetical protein
VKRRFYLLLELPVRAPAKVDNKVQFLDEIQRSAGDDKCTIIKSYYMDGKSPERLDTFEVILLIIVSDRDILKIKDALKRKYTYEQLNVYPEIFLKRKKGLWLDITSLLNDKNMLNKLRKRERILLRENMVETIQDFEFIRNDAHEQGN